MLFDFCFCFFFQAEDGIRDLIVTGVQTCALPISRRKSRRRPFFRHFSTCPNFAARSEERRVGKSVDLGGRRIIKKKKKKTEERTKKTEKKKTKRINLKKQKRTS